MMIQAYVGSPRKSGYSASMTRKFAEIATRGGHQVQINFLYDMKFQGCLDCGTCKNLNQSCCLKDDFTAHLPDLVLADAFLFASPIYLGGISGQMKLFFDRWCTFFTGNFLARQVVGKKFMTILACVSPSDRFKNVLDYMNYYFGDFFRMERLGGFIAGDLRRDSPVDLRPEILANIEELASKLK